MSALWFALSFGFYGFSVWGPAYFKARGFQTSGVYQAITLSVLCQLPGVGPSHRECLVSAEQPSDV